MIFLLEYRALENGWVEGDLVNNDLDLAPSPKVLVSVEQCAVLCGSLRRELASCIVVAHVTSASI